MRQKQFFMCMIQYVICKWILIFSLKAWYLRYLASFTPREDANQEDMLAIPFYKQIYLDLLINNTKKNLFKNIQQKWLKNLE